MIDNLPSDLRQEAIHYIEELARRKRKPAAKKFSLTWAGGSPTLKAAQHLWSSSIRHTSGGTDVYLLDTNIFLELLLDQKEAASVQTLFNTRAPADLHISDLAFHSIGIIL